MTARLDEQGGADHRRRGVASGRASARRFAAEGAKVVVSDAVERRARDGRRGEEGGR
jgi:NAD(P)-dependent dehydrogenase (short-subunit alcohol dehydrogenase family)